MIDGLLVLGSGTTAIVAYSFNVAQQDVCRGILVLGCYKGMVRINLSIGSILGKIELTTESYEVLGILLVSLVVRLHLLVQICGFTTDNVLNSLHVGFGAVLGSGACAVTCGQRSDE